MAIASGSAAAALPVPRLVTTDPSSSEAASATSVTPLVLGEAEPGDGVIIESIRLGTRSLLAPMTRAGTKNPTYEIQIFDGVECTGAMVGAGRAEALEGAGIPVSVVADTKTTLWAWQVESGTSERSECSNPLPYWEGNVPPGQGSSSGGDSEGGGSGQGSGGATLGGAIGPGSTASGKPDAPRIHTNPGDRANDMTPLVVGSAPGANSVLVYASANCSGSPVANGAPSQLSSGFEVPVVKNAETTFSAVAIGSQHSGCSSSVTYTEDSTAPRTRVTMGPGVKTRKRKAVFRFKDVTEDPPGTTFRCRVDKAKWKPCISPFRLKHLKLGHHVVAIRATDLAGNVERNPVKRRFIVVPSSGR